MVLKLDVKQAGLSLGLTFAAWHFIGVLLVAVGGSAFVSLVLNLHHLSYAVATLPLDIVGLILGTVVAFISGSLTGALFATVWNAMEKK